MPIITTDDWGRRLAEQALGDGATIPGIPAPVTPDDPRLYIRCAASRGDAAGQAFWPRTPGARVRTDPSLIDQGNDDSCPTREGDGVCAATCQDGMRGNPVGEGILLVWIDPEDVLTGRRAWKVYRKLRATAATVVAYIPLARAIGPGAYLCHADLHGADLHGADLSWADLHGADLHGADLHGADLSWASLHGADLHGADLHGADLTGADLSWADLTGATPSGLTG
nr:MAG TPA: pentapeptide repeat protein [Caudoviricetes sp.]